MQSLTDMVEKELEACGFSKEAYNPFTTADRDRPVTKHDESGTPLQGGGATDGEQADFAKERGRDHQTSPTLRSHPAKVARALADALPMKKILRAAIEKKASSSCGLKSRNECYQVFTSSDIINKIKLAGLREMAVKMLPDSMLLPLLRRMRGGSTFPTQYADDLEAMIMGRGLRSAAEAGDVGAARSIFEGAGGVPTIEPSALAGLQLKAQALDQYVKDPLERYLSGMRAGGLTGIGAGVGGTLGAQHLMRGERQ